MKELLEQAAIKGQSRETRNANITNGIISVIDELVESFYQSTIDFCTQTILKQFKELEATAQEFASGQITKTELDVKKTIFERTCITDIAEYKKEITTLVSAADEAGIQVKFSHSPSKVELGESDNPVRKELDYKLKSFQNKYVTTKELLTLGVVIYSTANARIAPTTPAAQLELLNEIGQRKLDAVPKYIEEKRQEVAAAIKSTVRAA